MPDRPPAAPSKWWRDPLAWVELFALSNVAFLAADVGLAHAINDYANPAEYVPVAFSLAAPVVLLAAMAMGGLRPATAGLGPGRGLGLAVGWGSVAVGIAGFVLHLDSVFFDEQTLKNLVYTAPFAAPLAYAGIGLLLLLNRMVDARSLEWARWVVLLALGGFVGNFVLTLADHAQNGFFHPTEWVGVVASAWAVSSLCAVLAVPGDRPLLRLAAAILAAQVAVGLLGAYLHLTANLRMPAESLRDRLLYGAPLFAPLLFADLAMLAGLALWGVARDQAGEVHGGDAGSPGSLAIAEAP
jgi:hypothetical protein